MEDTGSQTPDAKAEVSIERVLEILQEENPQALQMAMRRAYAEKLEAELVEARAEIDRLRAAA